jgi:putative FmdB family regulatory protein
MPIYEYGCHQCGQRVEALQKLGDPPLTECASCGGELRRLISAPAFQFKGSGWYVTDYGGKGAGKEGDKEGGKGAKEAASGGTGDAGEASTSNGRKPAEGGEKGSAKGGEPAASSATPVVGRPDSGTS